MKEVTLGNGGIPDILEMFCAVPCISKGSIVMWEVPRAVRNFANAFEGFDVEELERKNWMIAVEVVECASPSEGMTPDFLDKRKKIGAHHLVKGRLLVAGKVLLDVAKEAFTQYKFRGEDKKGDSMMPKTSSSGAPADAGLTNASVLKATHLNLTLCFQKMADVYPKEEFCKLHSLAIEQATLALNYEPGNKKALFRRAQSAYQTDELGFATRDVKSLLQLEEGAQTQDPAVRSLVRDINAKQEVIKKQKEEKKAKGSAEQAAKSKKKLASAMLKMTDEEREALDRKQEVGAREALEREEATKRGDVPLPVGISPIDIARRNNNKDIMNVFQKHQEKLDREKEVRHQQRRDAGCMNSDTDEEDWHDQQKLKKWQQDTKQMQAEKSAKKAEEEASGGNAKTTETRKTSKTKPKERLLDEKLPPINLEGA